MGADDDETAQGYSLNTNLFLIVTNQKMTYAELQRLAVQVHTSLGRAIQPLMDVQVQRRTEALEESHGAALLGTQVPVLPNAPAQLREERLQERAQDLAREAGVVGAAVAQGVGEGEDPLAHRHLGEHAVDEVRGSVGHAAAAARGTEAAAFAGERHEPIVPTRVAVQAQKAVGEDPAAKKGAELLLDETRRWPLAGSCAGEEGLELLAKGAVQGGLVRGSRAVGASLLDGDGWRARAVRRRLLGMGRFVGTSGVHGAEERLRGTCLL
jgi:hypothetical protein